MLISSFGQVFAYTVGNGQSTEGKDFWVTFMQADQDPNNSLVLSLSIAAREDCQVTICNPYTGYSEVVSVSANQLQQVELYNGDVLRYYARASMSTTGKVCYAVYSEQSDTCALHITATKNISLFATNYKKATFDATNVLPTAVLGDEYYVQTYTPSDHDGASSTQGSHFAIIATEDNTIIDYCPTEKTQAVNDAFAKQAAGYDLTSEELALVNFQVGDTLHSPVLMKGQVWYVWTGMKDGTQGDLSGTYVKARNGKKIAVFQGCPHTNIPYQVRQRDHIFSQAMPMNEWGNTFVLTASAERPSDIIRVMALNDETTVYINGEQVYTFNFASNPKRYWEFEIGAMGTYAQNGSCVLTTSCPCAVHLFMTSQRHNGDKNSVGDPSMMWINPIEEQMDKVTFATCTSMNGTTANYVNVVTDQPNLMTLDGTSIASEFSPVSGSSTHYFARVSLGDTATSHTLQSNGSQFIAHVYGFTANESYGYSVGGILNTMAYNVTVNYDETKGNVIARLNRGGGLCTGGDYLKAIPNDGFRFLQWNDGSTDNPRYIYLTQDTTFTALFTENNYTISVTCDSTRGIIDGESGVFSANTELTYTAIPKYGYHFEHWSDYWWNTSNPRTILVDSDVSIEAIFAPNKYSISALNNPNGEVTGTGTYDYLTECSIATVPHYGYHFTQWNDGNTDNPRTIVLTQDTTFAAFYAVDKSGSCGDDLALTWSYDATIKALTISGEGALNSNYTFGIEAPDNLEKLVIAEGVTSIGQGAFANQTTLQEISLPETVKTVGEQAFYNCIGLTHIYNYRERPCVAYSNTFDGIDKFDCTLHVLSTSVDMYKAATGWRDFYYVQTIDAVETTTSTQEVTVEPTDNTATMTWPTSENAATYTIEITKDGVVFCTLIFNGNGQLTGIAFAPSRSGSHHAPAAVMTANGLQFTVTGLNSATQYGYSLTAKDEIDGVVAAYSGEFTTTGAATAIDQISTLKSPVANKVIKDGQIYILRGDKEYTIQGQEVK